MADCPFGWGGATWGSGDLQAFKDWLADHGASYDQWANDHPDADACLKGQVGPSSSSLPPVPAAAATITQLEGPPVPASQQPAVEAGAQAALAAQGPPVELAPPAYVAIAPDGSIITTPIQQEPSAPPTVTPAAPEAPTPVTVAETTQIHWTHTELMQLWVDEGGFPEAADTAAAIAQAESSACAYDDHGPVDDRPAPVCTFIYSNGENSKGLWQINLDAHPQYSVPTIYDPVVNCQAAIAISNQGTDFGPWTTYGGGAANAPYRQYLTGQAPPAKGAERTPTISPAEAGPPPGQVTPNVPAGISGAWDAALDVLASRPGAAQTGNQQIIDSIRGEIR